MNNFLQKTQKTEEIFWHVSTQPVPYPQALDKMQHISRAIAENKEREMIWLLEHLPVFTSGTSAKAEDLFNPHHYPVYAAGRGGQWTYHGPGQRIAYIMLDLKKQHGLVPPRDVHAYIHALEDWLKLALSKLSIESFTNKERVGLWCLDPHTKRECKIAALGVRLSRWISWHGASLNVHPDLTDFEGIVPCGIRDYGVTSLERFHPGIRLQDADEVLAQSWSSIFGQEPGFHLSENIISQVEGNQKARP